MKRESHVSLRSPSAACEARALASERKRLTRQWAEGTFVSVESIFFNFFVNSRGADLVSSRL
jgi:hypothetical protein